MASSELKIPEDLKRIQAIRERWNSVSDAKLAGMREFLGECVTEYQFWLELNLASAESLAIALRDALKKLQIPLRIQLDMHTVMCAAEGQDITGSNAYIVAKKRVDIADAALQKASEYGLPEKEPQI
jgi:hypothetical protein